MTTPEDEYVEDPDDDIDYGDDDEDPEGDDDDEDAAGPEHEEGRRWQLISETSDSITRAMEIGRQKPAGSRMGCLVRVETYGAEGEYSSSVTFIPEVSLVDLKHETHPEPDAESGSSPA